MNENFVSQVKRFTTELSYSQTLAQNWYQHIEDKTILLGQFITLVCKRNWREITTSILQPCIIEDIILVIKPLRPSSLALKVFAKYFH